MEQTRSGGTGNKKIAGGKLKKRTSEGRKKHHAHPHPPPGAAAADLGYHLAAGSGWSRKGKRTQKFGVPIFAPEDFIGDEGKARVMDTARDLVNLARYGDGDPNRRMKPLVDYSSDSEDGDGDENQRLVPYSSSEDDDSTETLIADTPSSRGRRGGN